MHLSALWRGQHLHLAAAQSESLSWASQPEAWCFKRRFLLELLEFCVLLLDIVLEGRCSLDGAFVNHKALGGDLGDEVLVVRDADHGA